MNKSVISAFFLISSTLMFLGLAWVFNTSKPRVMILHSYNPDYIWTREVNVGLRRIVDEWRDYSVFWHYMDTKKFREPGLLEKAGIVARQAIIKNDPDVLIAIDDDAQKYAARYFINDPNIDIVFAGVNASVEPYGYYQADNVTGIYERKQFDAIKETILAIKKKVAISQEGKDGKDGKESKTKVLASSKPPRLLFMLDPSRSLQSDRRYIDDYNWEPIEYIGSVLAKDFEHWKQIVLDANKIADYILVANYRKLTRTAKHKTMVHASEVMTWTEKNSPIPVVGVNMFNVEDGAMLSIGVSPYEQGEVVAKMAQRIIEEKIRASKIPIVNNKNYVIAMRQDLLEKRNIVFPKIYEAFGRATANFLD